ATGAAEDQPRMRAPARCPLAVLEAGDSLFDPISGPELPRFPKARYLAHGGRAAVRDGRSARVEGYNMTRRAGRRHARLPDTEQLEQRCLLAGNVLVAVNGGELDITGDGASNGVLITAGSGHQFTVRGIPDNGPTMINGKPLVNVDGVRGDIKVALGGG